MPKSSLKTKRTAAQLSNSAREVLLIAAKHLFAQKGLSGTTIRDIAVAAKMNSSQISYYFEGKEGLYRACIQNIAEERVHITEQILQPPRSSEEYQVRLRLFIENFFLRFLEDRETGLIIIREFDRLNSPAAKIFKTYFNRLYDLLMNFFSVALKNKYLRAPTTAPDPLTITSCFFGMLMSELRFDHLKEELYSCSIHNPTEQRKVIDHIVGLFS